MVFIIENNEYKEREIKLVKMMILFTNKMYQQLGIKLKYVLRKIVMINDNQNENKIKLYIEREMNDEEY